MRAKILRFFALFVVFLAPVVARADDRTNFLLDRLKYPPSAGTSDDPRVRASAALALGTTGDASVVSPLCQALSDPSDVVRTAVAAALGRLGRPEAVNCLKPHLAAEANPSVKTQIQKAIDTLGSAGGGGDTPPTQVANAKFYVSVSTVANGTTRAQGDVDRVVLGAIRAKLASLGKYQLAPAGETSDAAKAVIASRNLKAYYLSVSLDKFDYSDGNLRVKVKIAVSTYPGKDLKGEVPAGITQTGVNAGDRSSEDNLMGMCAGRATELFAQNFQ